MLTQEDIQYIQLMIDERIESSKVRPHSGRAEKDYHTTYDIRDLIMDHLAEFKQWIGAESFQLALLRHFLAQRTTLRPRDLEIINNGRSNTSHIRRFDQQVANAVQEWRHGPFQKTDKPGHYVLAQH